jgi:sphingolipid delta-4 desaturase
MVFTHANEPTVPTTDPREAVLGSDAFVLVEQSQPHPDRGRAIMIRYPDVRRLFGPSPISAALAVVLVVLQLWIAYAISEQPIWVIFLASFFVGAFVDHALWVLLHECAHHLVFRHKTLNRLLALFINFPFIVPSACQFCIYHLTHHKYLGDTRRDGDMPPRWEGWLLKHGFLGRLVWQCLYPLTQGTRTLSLDPRGRSLSWVRWVKWNVLVQVVFGLLLLYFAGRHTFRYLLMSVFLSIGPHPLGARWIQEHYVFRAGQETYSYYGPLNVLSLNIGYHNEHHDLPQIAWHRLPTLRRLMPEMYDGLYYHTSLVRLWLRFLFDGNLQLYRIGRQRDG